MSASAEGVTMLRTMASMQDAHNRQVHADWRNQGYGYYRAIWVECAELLDHFGWKWWKHQEPDIDQVKLELVDIWHFGLSELLRADTLEDSVAATLDVAGDVVAEPEAAREAVERLAAVAVGEQRFDVAAFARVMQALGMSYLELYRMYVGKNVLNHFRQDHGYKTGEYVKLWSGREDNEHLVEVLAELDVGASDAPDQLYQALEARYAEI